jgi:hypothetical protein
MRDLQSVRQQSLQIANTSISGLCADLNLLQHPGMRACPHEKEEKHSSSFVYVWDANFD